MQQETQMVHWIVDQFSRRRINDEIIACAKAALPEILRRFPEGKEIDMQHAARLSLEVGLAMADQFVERDLI